MNSGVTLGEEAGTVFINSVTGRYAGQLKPGLEVLRINGERPISAMECQQMLATTLKPVVLVVRAPRLQACGSNLALLPPSRSRLAAAPPSPQMGSSLEMLARDLEKVLNCPAPDCANGRNPHIRPPGRRRARSSRVPPSF